MSKIKRDTLLGLVFFTGMGVLLLASLSLMDSLFYKTESISVRFPDASGIRDGDPVLVLGMHIGKVESVSYALDAGYPRHPILVELTLRETLSLHKEPGSDPMDPDDQDKIARIEIQDSTLLGGKQVWINPMPSNVETQVPGIELSTEVWTENLVGRSVGNPLEGLGETFSADSNLDQLLVSAGRFFDSLNSSEGTLGALATKNDVYDELLATVTSLRRTAEAVEEAQGTLGRLVYDQTIADDVAQTAQDLRSITNKVDEGIGPLGRVVNDDIMGVQLAGIVENVEAVTADLRYGRGTLGKLMQNDAIADNLDEALVLAVDLLTKANEPDAGLIGALLGDEDMRDDGARILANLAETTDKINEGSGLLGMLLNDEVVAQQFERLLDQLSRAVEDAREAAPVGTFFQVLAAPF